LGLKERRVRETVHIAVWRRKQKLFFEGEENMKGTT
jgi:hypothetical protein